MDKVINDFSIIVGTKNGSGSSTANNTILRAIFKMGIPVSGKNLFPSNIQGLPTWYTIRANKDGFIARREQQEIVVAMNPDSFARDLASVAPGGAFYYSDDIKQPITRADIAVYPMPVRQIVRGDHRVGFHARVAGGSERAHHGRLDVGAGRGVAVDRGDDEISIGRVSRSATRNGDGIRSTGVLGHDTVNPGALAVHPDHAILRPPEYAHDFAGASRPASGDDAHDGTISMHGGSDVAPRQKDILGGRVIRAEESVPIRMTLDGALDEMSAARWGGGSFVFLDTSRRTTPRRALTPAGRRSSDASPTCSHDRTSHQKAANGETSGREDGLLARDTG